MSIYGASYDFDQAGLFNFSGRSGNQLIWILTSFVVAFGIIMIDNDLYDIFAYWIYLFIILLLIATIFLAPDIKGSRSWLVLGPVNLQPAEFAKFATALALAKLMNQYKFKLLEIKNFLVTLGLILLPMLLILLQKETGSALVFLAFFIVLYREGMSGKVLFVGFCTALFFIISIKYADVMLGETALNELVVLLLIIAIVVGLIFNNKKDKSSGKISVAIVLIISLIAAVVYLFWPFDLAIAGWVVIGLLCGYLVLLFQKYWLKNYLLIALFALFSVVFLYSVDYVFNEILEPHQQVRLQVSFGLKDDPSGAGYNVNQSKIAIGSGGFGGKGYLNGTQTKLKYVPEQDTDFIFCTVGEEQGFVGTTIVLLLFLAMILRLIFLAERQRSVFNRVYGYCVALIIFFHVAVNIGMVIGITPVIGIPLPFFSYGGSSFLAFTILLFVFLRLDAGRKERL